MLKSIKGGARDLFYALLIILIFVGMANASDTINIGYGSGDTGFGWEDSAKTTKVTTGHRVEIILLGSGYIEGPSSSGAPVGLEDLRPVINPPNGEKMGYDTVGLSYTGVDGHFFHQRKSPSAGTKTFIARIWNADTPGPLASFGESAPFNQNFDFGSVDVYYKYFTSEDILAILPLSVPNPPSPATGESTQGIAGISPPSITLKCTSKTGARGFKWELRRSGLGTAYRSGTLWKDSYHTAYYSDGSNYNISIPVTPALAMTDDNQWYDFTIWATNSIGDSTGVSGSVFVKKNTDPNPPVAITDLRASVSGRSVTLNWRAPYDLDSHAAEIPCVQYDVRVSSEGIINPAFNPFSGTYYSKTNPFGIDTFAIAIPITQESAFSPTPVIPTPATYGTPESLVISNVLTDGSYFFAIKSLDDSGNWSYISNVAGVRIGVGASEETISYSLSRISGGLGINTMSIPFNNPISQTTSAIMTTLLDLIQQINIQKGSNVAYSLGWWDAATMKPAGYEIKYKSSTLNDIDSIISTTGLPTMGSAPIVKDRPYQVYVIDNTTFTIRGTRQ